MNRYGATAHLGLLAVVLCAGPLLAQSRGELNISDVGAFQGVGQGSSSHTFQSYSFGLGSLGSSYSSPGTSPLQSSLGPAQSFLINRPGLTDAAGADPLGAAPTGKYYGSAAPEIIDVGATGEFADALAANRGAIGGVTRLYLDAAGRALLDVKPGQAEPITSLVPSQPSLYRTMMEDGERAFRTGDFSKALSKFQLANTIGEHDPESLLSMAHASFATARFSYARPAYYLRLALRYLPELPLLPIRPKEFYGEPALYVGQLILLEEHLQRYPHDADANLVMAYLSWFSDKPQTAREALLRALGANNEADTIQAIEAFWAGMAASGKVSGKLLPPASAPWLQPGQTPAGASTQQAAKNATADE